jgi:integrase
LGRAQKRLRERLQARDNNTLPALRRGQDLAFGEWADFYRESFSRPPFGAQKTHEVNQRALKHLRKMFESTKLAELTVDDIEMYLRKRLKHRALVKTKDGFVEKQVLKPTTVHQELRVLRRMLNVAVRKKFLFANPCAGVEFPARVDGLFLPHYVTWSEQQKIEFAAPEYLRNVIGIVTETGLRIYKELMPIKKDQLDLVNRTVWIPDSKTPNGVAEVPLTNIAADAFRNQLAISAPGPYLFSSDEKCQRSSEDVQDRLARDVAASEGAVFPQLRSPLDIRHPALRRRRRARVGHAVAPLGRRQSVQEVFANEAADETRGAGETQPASERTGPGFSTAEGQLNRVLAQFLHSRGKETAKQWSADR